MVKNQTKTSKTHPNIYIGTNYSNIRTKSSNKTMATLTKKEAELLLLLFKDFTTNYNSNSISKKVNLTARGALKVLKSLDKKRLLTKKQYGKAVFYKVNTSDYYVFRVIETLLIQEAREKASRWLFDFEEIINEVEIVILFGSIIRTPRKAEDVDVLLAFKEEKLKKVNDLINQKNKILLKPIHPIFQTKSDFKENLKLSDPVVINAARKGYILHGYEDVIEVIRDVTSF